MSTRRKSTSRPRQVNKLFRKNAYMGFRLPATDRAKIELAAERAKRDPSDFVWVAAMELADRVMQQQGAA